MLMAINRQQSLCTTQNTNLKSRKNDETGHWFLKEGGSLDTLLKRNFRRSKPRSVKYLSTKALQISFSIRSPVPSRVTIPFSLRITRISTICASALIRILHDSRWAVLPNKQIDRIDPPLPILRHLFDRQADFLSVG
jgi:hypothetical protein